MSHSLCLSVPDIALFLDWWQQHRAAAGIHHFVWQADRLPAWSEVARAIEARLGADGEPLARQLQAHWWGLIPGWHRLPLEDERLILQLALVPVREALAGCTGVFDSIHAGSGLFRTPGLEPAHLAAALAALSRHGTRLHLGTASCPADIADAVHAADITDADWRHALRSKGWQTADGQPTGYFYSPHWIDESSRSSVLPSTAIVIGAGLSGAASAWSLARRGWEVTVLDAGPAPAAGASGLPVGLVVPHTSADDTRISQISRAGVRCMLHRAKALLEPGLEWSQGGVLEHCVDGDSKLARAWQAPDAPDALRPSSEWAHRASPQDIAQACLPQDITAILHPGAAWIKPAALVSALLRRPGIRFQGNGRVAALQRADSGLWQALDADGQVLAQARHVVIAAAYHSSALLQQLAAASGQPACTDAPFGIAFKPLRGQIAWGWQDDLPHPDALPPFPVNGKGSMAAHIPHATPERQGPMWITGSTFNRGDTDPSPRERDMGEILAKLQILHPAAGKALAPAFAQSQARAWAGVRTTLPDRLPVVGPLPVPGLEGISLCAGMGARGLALAMLCGEQMAALLHDEPWPQERKLGQMLSASRWLRNAR